MVAAAQGQLSAIGAHTEITPGIEAERFYKCSIGEFLIGAV